MARPRSFDTGAAVRAARQVFWARGYEATSLSDLEEATGLRRSRLYQAFGSKRGLFDAAVASYLDEVVRPLLGGLHPRDGTAVSPTALEEYLHRLATALAAQEAAPRASRAERLPARGRATGPGTAGATAPATAALPTAVPPPTPTPRGCLLVNTGTSPIGEDPAVAAIVAGYRAELRSAVGSGLTAARADLDPAGRNTLTEAVTALVVAAFAMARTAPGAAQDSVRAALSLVTTAPQR